MKIELKPICDYCQKKIDGKTNERFFTVEKMNGKGLELTTMCEDCFFSVIKQSPNIFVGMN